MKIRQVPLLIVLLILSSSVVTTFAQGTAFTYQGQLTDRGSPASGIYDLRFALYDDSTNGAVWYQMVTNVGVAVSDGLLTTLVDFGASPFDGTARWLEIAVATNDSGVFVPLAPRQPLTPAPYALFATNAGLAINATTALGVAPNSVTVAGIANSNITSAKIAGGQVVKSLNQLKDDVLLGAGTNINMAINGNMIVVSSPTWSLTGNADTAPGANFLGTIDSQPLDVRVNNARALRLEPTAGAPNLIGGAEDNVVGEAVTGATISGGQGNQVAAQYATVGGGTVNHATAATATVGGGSANAAQGTGAAIGGGTGNTIQVNADNAAIVGGLTNTIEVSSILSVIGGGWRNMIQNNAAAATIGGGYGNTIETNAYDSIISGGASNRIQIDAWAATIGGGDRNTIKSGAQEATISGGGINVIHSNAVAATIGGGVANTVQPNGEFATIPGGRNNIATNWAFAAGRRAKANHTGSFVWADSTDADFASTTNKQFNVRANGGVRFETGGAGMTVDGMNVLAGTVPSSGLSGTYTNSVTLLNMANVFVGAFSGEGSHLMNVDASTLEGLSAANFWRVSGNADTSPGTHFLGTIDNQPLELRVNSTRALRLEPTTGAPNVICGAEDNVMGDGVTGGTIGGGSHNSVVGPGATVAGGSNNRAGGIGDTVGGGASNQADSNDHSVIGGGAGNIIEPGAGATISGGWANKIRTDAFLSTIGGGINNEIRTNAWYATISGGNRNTICSNGCYGVISGGMENTIAENAYWAMILGGRDNTVGTNAAFAFAAGHHAKALHEGAFVWADSTDADFASTVSNQFLIRASGGVGIRTNAPQAQLDVVQPSSGAVAFRAYNAGNTNYALIGGNWYGVYGYASSPSSYDFYAGGPGIDYGSSSSRRWKTNVQPIADPLEKLARLRGVYFDWDAAHGGRHDLGMIAEEVGAVLPEIVAYETNGLDAVAMDYSRLSPLLVEALKALEQRVAEKDATIAGLEKRLEKLERVLTQQNGGAE